MPEVRRELLEIGVSHDAHGNLVLALRGDVCLVSAPRFGEALGAAIEASPRAVVVDLHEVGVFGAAALGQLAVRLAVPAAADRTVVFRGVRPLHRTILVATGFGDLVEAVAVPADEALLASGSG